MSESNQKTPDESIAETYAAAHQAGYEAGRRSAQGSDTEVARLRLPIGVSALSGLVDAMSRQYGKAMILRQVETWLVFERLVSDSTKPNS